MDDKKLTKNVLIVAVLAIALSIGIGFSFAYFHAKILGNDKALKNKVQAGTLELSFVDDNAISITNENGKPGSKASKTFSVTNTSTLDEDFTYNIKLVMTELTFVKRDLKYILEEYPDATFQTPKENGIKEEGYINTDSVNEKNEMYLAVDIPRPAKGATHYYKLTVDFQELNIPQDYNQEAKFIGKVNVDDEKNMIVYEQAPNAPELYQGMIPVYFNDGKIYIADASKDDWYDYVNNEWANAILIDYQNKKDKFYDGDSLRVNTVVNEEDILQMYVWIPRYRYKLFNAENWSSIPKQIINIEFEKDTETTGNVSCTYTDMKNGTVKEDCKNAVNGNWYTHPAFTFGDTQLKGFWVGKFEPSDPTDETGRNVNSIGEITILPNKTSMVLKSVSTIFNAERDIENKNATKYNLNFNEIDTHMMKNIEWGAVAYLTQSVYGIYKDEATCNIKDMDFSSCEVWINNTAQGTASTGEWNFGGTATGCVGSTSNAKEKWNENGGNAAICTEDKKWNTENGVKASTTGNIYGIYDMSGGAWEYVMLNVVEKTGGVSLAKSGINDLNIMTPKYYDMYSSGESILKHERGHLGDATRETLEIFGENPGGWNEDISGFPYADSKATLPWAVRGGLYDQNDGAGLFAIGRTSGSEDNSCSFRSVLSAA